ncbi:MAG: DMT family transporter [Candidatus Zixiibacteriota bacterium]
MERTRITVTYHQKSAATAGTGSATTGYILAVVSTASAGLATVVGKWNLESIGPLLMNSLIFSVASVAMGAVLLPTRGLKAVVTHSRRGWFWLGLFSATSWLAVWAFWAGVQRMDPSLAAFLNRSEVLIAIMLAMVFLKERFNRVETLGAVLSIAGIIIMRLTLRVDYSAGFWYVLLGSLFFGLTEFVSKIAVRYVEPVLLAYVRNTFMAIGYWIVLLSGGVRYDGLEKVWPGVLALGLIGPILSRMVYLLALKRLDLSKVAIISQGQPVFVILIALLALGQLPTFREAVGGLFLMVGCLIMIAGRSRMMDRVNYLRRNRTGES